MQENEYRELSGKLVRGVLFNNITKADCIRISIDYDENGNPCEGIVACHLMNSNTKEKLLSINNGDKITVIGRRNPNTNSIELDESTNLDEEKDVIFIFEDCDICIEER